MSKKNQTTQANDSSNSIVELSDEDLQQVVGGNNNDLQLTLRPYGGCVVLVDSSDY
jgi:bacteriocin-like protein